MLELNPGLSTRVTPGLNIKWKIFVHKTIRSKNQLHRSLLSDSNWYTFHHSLVGLHIWRVSGCPQPRWSFARSKWVGEPDYQSPVWQAQPLSTSIGTCSCSSHHAMANLVVNRLTLSHCKRTLLPTILWRDWNFLFLNEHCGQPYCDQIKTFTFYTFAMANLIATG